MRLSLLHYSLRIAAAAALILSGCALPGNRENRTESSQIRPTGERAVGMRTVSGKETDAEVARTVAFLDASGKVSLPDLVQAALQNNLEVKIAKLGAEVAGQGEEIARAEFDPDIAATLARTTADGDVGANAVVSKKFSTGTEIYVEGGNTFYDATRRTQGTTGRNGDVLVGVRQPLLRGADRTANQSGIFIARILARSADASAKAEVLEMLRGAESAYWTASAAKELLAHQNESLVRARRMLSLVQGKSAAGAATRLDELEAEAAVASAQELVARAKKRYLDAVSVLWYVSGASSDASNGDLSFAPLTSAPLPQGTPKSDERWRSAMQHSPSAALLANEVARQELQVRKAKNDRLPNVDLEVDYATSDALSLRSGTQSSADEGGASWAALLRVSIPWTFREERARLRAAQLELEQSHLAREKGMRELKMDIQESCRAIEAGQQELTAAVAGSRVNREKHAEQFRRYETGIASVRDVMEADGEYRHAQAVEIDARLRVALSCILLSRQDASIPQRHGLSM